MRAYTFIIALAALLTCWSAPEARGATHPDSTETLPRLAAGPHTLQLPAVRMPAPAEALMGYELDRRFKPAVTLNIYDLPYSRTLSVPNWGRMWANTAVLVAGGTTAMVILEALPEDATAWNRNETKKVPFFKRWVNHVKAGPVWDGDKFIFNWVLHPYAGAAYYMSARSCGFNCWGSFLYSFCISTFFWEYGFESFNEIPSVQDLVVTPVVGSLIGEGFYLIKRHIVDNGYRLLGSPVLGYAVAFICDPVNEVMGYFRGFQRSSVRYRKAMAGQGASGGAYLRPGRHGGVEAGFSLTYTF